MAERMFNIDRSVGNAQSRFDGLVAQGIDRIGSWDLDQRYVFGRVALYAGFRNHYKICKSDRFDYGVQVSEPWQVHIEGQKVPIVNTTIIGRLLNDNHELVVVVSALQEPITHSIIWGDTRPYNEEFEDRLIQLIEQAPLAEQ